MSSYGKDDLGNRMKNYEKVQTSKVLDKYLPIYCRLDGRSFSKFSKNFKRPYDATLSDLMVATTQYLMDQTKAQVGYTQSDEISLGWKPATEEISGFFFEGKIQKLTSVLSGMATSYFTANLEDEDLRKKYPHFDCRILNLPNMYEVANMIAWREIDARKNAISSLAREHFSHKELQGKSGKDMLTMLRHIDVFMTDMPSAFQHGTMLRRNTVEKTFNSTELESIPEKFKTKEPVLRSVVERIYVSPFSKVQNKIDVIFGTSDPVFKQIAQTA